MGTQTYGARIFELVSVGQTDAILKSDCRVHGYKPKFISANSATAYFAVNCWLGIIQDYCDDYWVDVRNTLAHDGLINTVVRFAAAADELVHSQPVSDPFVSEVLSAVRINDRSFVATDVLGYRPGPLAAKLQICRFLKRITLQHRADVERAAKDGFYQTQLRLASDVLLRYESCESMLEEVRKVLARCLPWDEIVSKIRSMGPDSRTFTSGASSDAGGEFANKLKRMAQVNPGYFQPIFGNYLFPFEQTVFPEYTGEPEFNVLVHADTQLGKLDICHDGNYRHKHCVRIGTAPKNVKGPRIIAMEPVNEQTAQRFVKDILYRYLPAGVYLRDQTVNQRLAEEASRSGIYATLDLHAASDYVTKALVLRIFPTEFTEAIWRYVPSHYELKKRIFPLFSFATMGNGLTFWVESLTFWAIASVWSGVGNSFVYGDDLVVPTRVAGVVTDVLQELGFVVNNDKSFTAGPYRESCGKEYSDGIPCQSVYYPRFPVHGEVTGHTCVLTEFSQVDADVWEDSSVKLIQLQQRLSNVSLTATRFLAGVLKDAHPSMTTSRWGSVSPDIWGPDQLAGPDSYAPAAVIVTADKGAAGDAALDDEHDIHACTFEPVPVARLPHAALRETWYCPHEKSREAPDDDLVNALLTHYAYGRFLKYGPRRGDPVHDMIPESVHLPDLEADRLRAKVVVWDISNK